MCYLSCVVKNIQDTYIPVPDKSFAFYRSPYTPWYFSFFFFLLFSVSIVGFPQTLWYGRIWYEHLLSGDSRESG